MPGNKIVNNNIKNQMNLTDGLNTNIRFKMRHGSQQNNKGRHSSSRSPKKLINKKILPMLGDNKTQQIIQSGVADGDITQQQFNSLINSNQANYLQSTVKNTDEGADNDYYLHNKQHGPFTHRQSSV